MASPRLTPEPSPALFPRLPGGPSRMSKEAVARHQRARLEGAMIEAVARRGYAATTLRELVGIAGVSKSTFYEHFSNKEECFFATFDAIIDRLTARVAAAYRQPGDPRERLVAALETFMNLAIEAPADASLTAVEALTLGRAGVERRERGSRAFELMVGQSLERDPRAQAVSPVTVRAIVAGILGVVYRRLRAGKAEELPKLAGELVDWALLYQKPDSPMMKRAAAAAAVIPPLPEREEERLSWDEPPDSQRSRAELSQRERIVRATARVVAERGYGALSIPAISAAAGTSNQTFYENFPSKREAFLAAFDELSSEALAVTAAAFESHPELPEAVGASIRSMLEQVAANEILASIAFFELQAAGPTAMDRADNVMNVFTAFLAQGTQAGTGLGGTTIAVREAIGSGVWTAIQHEIAHGRRDALPQLAPQLARIALAPFS